VFLIREIMYCKPGKVRPLVEKFLAVPSLQEFETMMSGSRRPEVPGHAAGLFAALS
jgi:hypothetical protein